MNVFLVHAVADFGGEVPFCQAREIFSPTKLARLASMIGKSKATKPLSLFYCIALKRSELVKT